MKSGYDRIGNTVTVEHAKRSCLDKRPFNSKNDARDAAARNGKKFGLDFRWYRCTLCHRFHLTTKTPDGLRRGKDHRATGKAAKPAKQSPRLPEEG